MKSLYILRVSVVAASISVVIMVALLGFLALAGFLLGLLLANILNVWQEVEAYERYKRKRKEEAQNWQNTLENVLENLEATRDRILGTRSD